MARPKVAVLTETEVATGEDADIKLAGPWNVILYNDDHHTYEYVIAMLMKLFGHTQEKAFACAREVDTTGRAIVDTTSRERAELKRDQIHAFGPDPLSANCAGSMSSSVEPA